MEAMRGSSEPRNNRCEHLELRHYVSLLHTYLAKLFQLLRRSYLAQVKAFHSILQTSLLMSYQSNDAHYPFPKNGAYFYKARKILQN